jgi:hypothetical protein
MNETILPTDHKRAGQIVDDDLNRALVRPLQTGVTLHAVIDACHSGTALDLPYRTTTKNGRFDWKVSSAWYSGKQCFGLERLSARHQEEQLAYPQEAHWLLLLRSSKENTWSGGLRYVRAILLRG